MSSFSSVMRTEIWGGLPISLPSLSVFVFLAFWGVFLIVTKRQRDRSATLFYLLATLLPVIASALMGYLSLVTPRHRVQALRRDLREQWGGVFGRARALHPGAPIRHERA